jgi:hypothetical protein
MSGAHSRRKGADFERLLVQRFRDVMPDSGVRRGLQYRSGDEVPDVDVPCFWLEAKHHHRVNIREAMRQAIGCSAPGRWPLAVTKDDNAPALVTMQLEDFLELVREWWERRPR